MPLLSPNAVTSLNVIRAASMFLVFCALSIVAQPLPAFADEKGPFIKLPGRWVGEGRLGFKSGDVENIKCRATYFVKDEGERLKQNIRCASASGKVELKSDINHGDGDSLSGTWEELLYNLSGKLDGSITDRGFRIKVLGKDLHAHMEIIVKDNLQIVEIHFDSATLIGMTLLLKKG